ncbi:hypothetical protein BJ912DRAFT_1052165 [Pholiota molesta]|nr:hypothetical protein BJ912DRAFT_1052165 [Pholiota molesta]
MIWLIDAETQVIRVFGGVSWFEFVCCHHVPAVAPAQRPFQSFHPTPRLGLRSFLSLSHGPRRRRQEQGLQAGQWPATDSPVGVAKHGHSRSHSRNLSISSSFSFPPSKSTTHRTFSFAPHSPAVSESHIAQPPSPSKRNSHHRRRSSVSTRHESAEMMGVALPDLPPSTSDDNINLGEKDSIRRRALWALEGKPDVSFNKVEIPDISTPDMEKIMFDFYVRCHILRQWPQSNHGQQTRLFKLLATSSSAKDQLHTLVEEEEEDESLDVSKEDLAALPSPTSSIKENVPPSLPSTPVFAVTKPTPSKSRPSNLHLRPLSLTPENLNITPTLPSPTPTPSPRSGLRSLSLTPSSSIDESTLNGSSSTKQSRRTSLVISPTPAAKRPVLNLALEQLGNSAATSTCDDDSKPTRRSSISYKQSSHGSVTTNLAGLPTPEMTPTFGRRYSSASTGERDSISSFGFGAGRNSSATAATEDDSFFPAPPTQTRPLSASEQHFLFKSHNALLARITDLERALMMRRRESGGAYSAGGSSRPMSAASSRSSLDGAGSASPLSSSEPSDEMLRLIADLKAERDELKRDADGWRTRVSDMEAQLGVLAKRVENERREAWVARSRVGLLEVEKGVLSKKLDAVEELNALRREEHALQQKRWEEERGRLVGKEDESRRKVGELEAELERVRKELEVERLMKSALIKERAAKEQEEKEIDPLATPTLRSFEAYTRQALSKAHGLGFASVDSESSITDVEADSSDDGQRNHLAFKLGSVQEESEDEDDHSAYTYSEETYYDDEEDSGLAGYEDEDEGDTDMSLQSSSSFGSEEDLPRSVAHLQHKSTELPPSPTTPTSNQVFTPPRPTGHQRRATLSKTWTFPFGAVPAVADAAKDQSAQDEDADDEEQDRPSAYSYEKTKGAFARAFKFAPEDDNASFFVPGVGFPAGDEEEEEEAEEQERRLSVVAEEAEEEEEAEEQMAGNRLNDYEEEDDSEMFGEIGGIRITFTPPQEEEPREERAQIAISSPTKRTSPPPMLPALDFGLDADEEDAEETCGATAIDHDIRAANVAVDDPRPASPSNNSLASSIPRPVGTPKPVAAALFTPAKPAVARAMTLPMSPPMSFVTPPTKRGGALPSFIPTPVSSPSPLRTLQRLALARAPNLLLRRRCLFVSLRASPCFPHEGCDDGKYER